MSFGRGNARGPCCCGQQGPLGQSENITILCDSTDPTIRYIVITYYDEALGTWTILYFDLNGNPVVPVDPVACPSFVYETTQVCHVAVADGVGYTTGDYINHTTLYDVAAGTLLPIAELWVNEDTHTIIAAPPDIDIQPCQTSHDVQQKLLCDVQPDGSIVQFMRVYTYDTMGVLFQIADYELDGTTPYVITGTVDVCENEIEQQLLCDALPDGTNIQFLRVYSYDAGTQAQLVNDYELDGVTPYVIQGVVGACEPDTFDCELENIVQEGCNRDDTVIYRFNSQEPMVIANVDGPNPGDNILTITGVDQTFIDSLLDCYDPTSPDPSRRIILLRWFDPLEAIPGTQGLGFLASGISVDISDSGEVQISWNLNNSLVSFDPICGTEMNSELNDITARWIQYFNTRNNPWSVPINWVEITCVEYVYAYTTESIPVTSTAVSVCNLPDMVVCEIVNTCAVDGYFINGYPAGLSLQAQDLGGGNLQFDLSGLSPADVATILTCMATGYLQFQSDQTVGYTPASNFYFGGANVTVSNPAPGVVRWTYNTVQQPHDTECDQFLFLTFLANIMQPGIDQYIIDNGGGVVAQTNVTLQCVFASGEYQRGEAMRVSPCGDNVAETVICQRPTGGVECLQSSNSLGIHTFDMDVEQVGTVWTLHVTNMPQAVVDDVVACVNGGGYLRLSSGDIFGDDPNANPYFDPWYLGGDNTVFTRLNATDFDASFDTLQQPYAAHCQDVTGANNIANDLQNVLGGFPAYDGAFPAGTTHTDALVECITIDYVQQTQPARAMLVSLCAPEGQVDDINAMVLELCDVQTDGTAVHFLRFYAAEEDGSVTVIADTDVSGNPYTVTGTVEDCDAVIDCEVTVVTGFECGGEFTDTLDDLGADRVVIEVTGVNDLHFRIEGLSQNSHDFIQECLDRGGDAEGIFFFTFDSVLYPQAGVLNWGFNPNPSSLGVLNQNDSGIFDYTIPFDTMFLGFDYQNACYAELINWLDRLRQENIQGQGLPGEFPVDANDITAVHLFCRSWFEQVVTEAIPVEAQPVTVCNLPDIVECDRVDNCNLLANNVASSVGATIQITDNGGGNYVIDFLNLTQAAHDAILACYNTIGTYIGFTSPDIDNYRLFPMWLFSTNTGTTWAFNGTNTVSVIIDFNAVTLFPTDCDTEAFVWFQHLWNTAPLGLDGWVANYGNGNPVPGQDLTIYCVEYDGNYIRERAMLVSVCQRPGDDTFADRVVVPLCQFERVSLTNATLNLTYDPLTNIVYVVASVIPALGEVYPELFVDFGNGFVMTGDNAFFAGTTGMDLNIWTTPPGVYQGRMVYRTRSGAEGIWPFIWEWDGVSNFQETILLWPNLPYEIQRDQFFGLYDIDGSLIGYFNWDGTPFTPTVANGWRITQCDDPSILQPNGALQHFNPRPNTTGDVISCRSDTYDSFICDSIDTQVLTNVSQGGLSVSLTDNGLLNHTFVFSGLTASQVNQIESCMNDNNSHLLQIDWNSTEPNFAGITLRTFVWATTELEPLSEIVFDPVAGTLTVTIQRIIGWVPEAFNHGCFSSMLANILAANALFGAIIGAQAPDWTDNLVTDMTFTCIQYNEQPDIQTEIRNAGLVEVCNMPSTVTCETVNNCTIEIENGFTESHDLTIASTAGTFPYTITLSNMTQANHDFIQGCIESGDGIFVLDGGSIRTANNAIGFTSLVQWVFNPSDWTYVFNGTDTVTITIPSTTFTQFLIRTRTHECDEQFFSDIYASFLAILEWIVQNGDGTTLTEFYESDCYRSSGSYVRKQAMLVTVCNDPNNPTVADIVQCVGEGGVCTQVDDPDLFNDVVDVTMFDFGGPGPFQVLLGNNAGLDAIEASIAACLADNKHVVFEIQGFEYEFGGDSVGFAFVPGAPGDNAIAFGYDDLVWNAAIDCRNERNSNFQSTKTAVNQFIIDNGSGIPVPGLTVRIWCRDYDPTGGAGVQNAMLVQTCESLVEITSQSGLVTANGAAVPVVLPDSSQKYLYVEVLPGGSAYLQVDFQLTDGSPQQFLVTTSGYEFHIPNGAPPIDGNSVTITELLAVATSAIWNCQTKKPY